MNSIKATYLKWRPKLFTWFTIALIAASILSIYFVVEVRVTSNDECLWIPKKITRDSTAIYFDVVKVEGVTWNAGIRNGDQLLEINGQVLNNTGQAQNILNEVPGGEYAEYVVKKADGELITTPVYVKKLIQYGNLASTLSALFWLLLGFIVLTAKPEGKIHKLFYAIGVLSVFSVMYIFMPMGYKIYDYVNQQSVLAFFLSFLWAVGLSFVGPALLYFFWNFPKPFKFVEKRWVKRILVIVPVISTVFIFSVTILTFGMRTTSMSYFFNMIEGLGNFLIGLHIIALISLILQYRRSKSKHQKKPVMLMIIAFSFGFALTIYSSKVAPALAESFFNSPEYFMPIVLIAIVPLIFAYAIFKYQLMDVGVVVRNTIIYGAATLTVAVIYFLVIYVAGQEVSAFFGAENQGIVAGIFFIIFAIVFQSTKNRFQDFLTKRFYPEQHAHQRVLMELSNELATVVGLDNILELMKKTFVDALNINKFGILIRDEDNN
ncbi:MAG: hypothetical protein O6940_00865, partial [Ignavibacteria bacterium]|nr:hypothetical protein [Ignavibacteria bacterium]